MQGNLDCLQWACENGCRVGYNALGAAICESDYAERTLRWELQTKLLEVIEWGVDNNLPHDGAWVLPYLTKLKIRRWTKEVVDRAAKRAVEELRREAAAATIQRFWLPCYYDPARSVCQRRLKMQFDSL